LLLVCGAGDWGEDFSRKKKAGEENEDGLFQIQIMM
jgi:hypothetical protein